MDEIANVTTIGFTQSSARNFFERLRTANVKRVLDVRLHNTSQLAGFAKADDLAYFLTKIGDIEYRHIPLLAPEEDMLSEYKKHKGSWSNYESRFLELMSNRKIETLLDRSLFDGACLLCSEHDPNHCHRRLVCEYLNNKWAGQLKVRHL
jgi:uncharacterized protein (DUF488 family)